MKLVLISDIHLGVKKNSEEFLNNTKKFFLEQVADVIENKKSNDLWILGDLFDHPEVINVLVKNVAIDIFNTLLERFPNLTIRILSGNHDIYYNTTLEVSSLNMFMKFNPRLEIIKTVKEYQLGSCKTLVVPWLVEDSLNWKNFHEEIERFNESQTKKYDLCFGHFSVNGFEVTKGLVENHGFSQETFKGFGSVFSGHFHIRKKYSNIQYLGCPYEITWNDQNDKKGITVFDTETKETEFIENNISPKHIIINLTSLSKDKTLIQDAKHNFVKLIIDQKISEHNFEKLKAGLEKMTQKLDIIDQTVEEIDDVELAIEEDIQKDGKAFLLKYIDEIQLSSDINKDEFKIYVSKEFDSVRGE